MAVGTFGIEKEDLQDLLKEAASGKSQLPEFQRGWVWPDRNIASLVASISLGYPVGTVMMLKTGGNVKFKERPIEGADFDRKIKPERLILDGQQRLTSLYRALLHQGPIHTQDIRKKPITGWFYIDIEKALSGEDSREDSIRLIPENRMVKNFRGEVIEDYSTSDSEYQNRLFPLNKVFDWQDWYQEYCRFWNNEVEANKIFLKFMSEVLKKFDKYQVPVIELPSETAKDAVCQVFEKVNTGGVTLTVFELLTATFAADEFDLRQDWASKKLIWSLPEHRVINNFSNTDLLQAVCLLATRAKREKFVMENGDEDKAPRIGCKRSDVLALSLDDFTTFGDQITSGLIEASKFLHSKHIFDSKFLPYGAQLIPLTAIFSALGHDAETHQAQQKISQWFWCGIFGELYGGTTETRFAFDVPEVVNWVRGTGPIPRTISEAQFIRDRLWTLRSRNSAAYKGLYALLLAEGARDWLTGGTISAITYFDDSIDVHHIFPQDWCEKNSIPPEKYNAIVNKTPLSARTNRIIGGNAPSLYVHELARRSGTSLQLILDAVKTHRVNSETLLQDNFLSHMEFRSIELLNQVKNAMGKEAEDGTLEFVAEDVSDEND